MKVFIEADSIANDRLSGIGHATLEMCRAMSNRLNGTNHRLILIIPYGKKAKLEKYGLTNVSVRTLPPGYKYVNYLLTRTSLPFPMDLFYGKGLYVFPNYKTWYTPFSLSLTFVHDVAYKIYPETIHPKNLIYLNANMERWMRRTGLIAAISKSSANEITEFFPRYKNKVALVQLGIDKEFFYRRPEEEVAKACKATGIHGRYFMYVGNIEPRKNIAKLLDSYEKYSDNVQNPAKLLIIGGGGWKNDSINARIQQLQNNGYGVVKPENYTEDDLLPALYSGADALVHVSIHEGFGLSVAQAQACGTMVVVSDIPVLREVTNPEGRILVNPADVDEIAQALKKVSENRKFVSNPEVSYTWDQTIEKITSLAGIVEDKNARR